MNHRAQVDAICVSADVLNTTLPLRRALSVRLQVIEFDAARTFGGLEMAALAQRVADSVDVFLRTSYGACTNGVANSNDFVPPTLAA